MVWPGSGRRRRIARWIIVFGTCAILSIFPAVGSLAQNVFNADPDPSNPTLHVQPPIEGDLIHERSRIEPGGIVNGITFLDVLAAAGYDLAGSDSGNEPAISSNPLNPNQIVITSFSGSSWATGGNSTIFSSTDAGATWIRSSSVPPPTGTSTNYNCPCDQNTDWGRDGILYAAFLHLNNGGSVQSVYTAQSTNPASAGSWSYRTSAGTAQKTNLAGLSYVDQPWLWSGPLATDNASTQVCVAYDNFNSAFSFSEMRDAESAAANPPDFARDAAANSDGQIYGDGMNPGNRIALGPGGVIWTVYQRYVSAPTGTVKQLTYLVNVSTNSGVSWGAANSDHASGAKIVAANVDSFQGNGSKVGNVNALLGGVDAINVDPNTGVAWIVYGTRATTTSSDQLWLVSATLSAGNIAIGTPRVISSGTGSAYLPALAILPSGEIGVLFLTWDGANFKWIFNQTTDGGVSIAKTTTLATFTSPFANNGQSNQRIFGDYVSVRASGCRFYGTYPSRGTGVNSVSSIDPYFMSAPPAASCLVPTLTALSPASVCAGGPGFSLGLTGTGFANGAAGRIRGNLRTTSYSSPAALSAAISAADISSPGVAAVDVVGPAPGGILTGALSLIIESPTVSPGNSLRLLKSGSTNLAQSWTACANADSYSVKRCTFGASPCSPAGYAAAAVNSFSDPVLPDTSSYAYLIEAVNACGSIP